VCAKHAWGGCSVTGGGVYSWPGSLEKIKAANGLLGIEPGPEGMVMARVVREPGQPATFAANPGRDPTLPAQNLLPATIPLPAY
jgi:hypothetical protein